MEDEQEEAFYHSAYQVWKLLDMKRKQLFHEVKVFNKSTQKGLTKVFDERLEAHLRASSQTI